MKVLMVSKACYVAAYRRKLEYLAAIPGVDLTLVTPPYWDHGTHKAPLEPGNDRGYRVVVENPALNGNFHLHFYRGLPELIRQVRPDILHIDEEPYDFVTLHALRAARGIVPRVLFFTWQNIDRQFQPPFNWFESRVLNSVHGAISGNQEGAQVLRRKGYARPLYVIPQFGVDTERFQPVEGDTEPSFSEDRPFRIGFSGRLVEEKGLLVLLRALRQLQGPWELRLLGSGPLEPRLKREAEELGIASRLSFRGAVGSEAVPVELRQFDALVNPSLTWQRGRSQWKEQFGRSFVEAMACGVPVVGSDSGEIPNVIGDAGLVAPEGNVDELHKALERLMGDPALRRRLAKAGRERVLQHYTQERIAQQTYQCYRQLLDGVSPSERP
ncbi:MAG: glycosyltransferase family 1 protein [Dehalococcoidia bacterium]|nr:glycosyltransferase family 1 protein [Dehalococcoidia bacterium]